MYELRIGCTVATGVAAAVALALQTMSATADKHHDNTGAVIGGLIAGAAIGAAVASSVNHPTTVIVNPKPPPPPSGPWSNGFHPKDGVTCYPVQHACYNKDGAYNANWTWKVYHR